MAELTRRERQQGGVERAIGMTQEEADYINANPELPEVKPVRDLLYMQSTSYDPGGFALLESAMHKLRVVMNKKGTPDA